MRAGRLMILFLGIYVSIPPCVLALDLKAAIDSALATSVDISRLREQATASSYGVKEKQGYFNPSIGIEVYSAETEEIFPIREKSWENSYAVSVTQPLYNPSLWSAYREAAINEEISSLQREEAENKLIFEMLFTVLNICRIRSRETVTSKNLEFVSQSVEFLKKGLKDGHGTQLDLFESEAELLRYQKELQEIQSQLRLETGKLAQLTDRQWPEEQFPVFTDLIESGDDGSFREDPKYWLDGAFSNNFQLGILYLNQEIGKIRQSAGYSEFKPEVDLTLTHSDSASYSDTDSRIVDNSITIGFSIGFAPVSAYYRLKRLNTELSALMLEEQKIKKDLRDKINNLLETLRSKRENLEAQRRWLDKQEQIGKMYQKAFEMRHFPVSRALEANRKQNDSQLGSIETIIGIWETRINLLQLAGKLDEKAIEQLDQVF